MWECGSLPYLLPSHQTRLQNYFVPKLTHSELELLLPTPDHQADIAAEKEEAQFRASTCCSATEMHISCPRLLSPSVRLLLILDIQARQSSKVDTLFEYHNMDYVRKGIVTLAAYNRPIVMPTRI